MRLLSRTVPREDIFVRKSFYSFFLPSLLSCIGIGIGGLADCIFVGNVLGAVGLTAITIGQPVYMLFNTTVYALSIGGSLRASNLLGEGREDEARKVFSTVFFFNLILNIVICIAALLFLPQVLDFLGAGAPGSEVWEISRQYVRAQLLLVPVMFCQGPFYYFVNMDDDPRTAAVGFVTSNLLDIIFNYIFVVRMGLGVAGSVYSTGVGAAAMILICLTHFIKKRGNLRFVRPEKSFAPVLRSFRTGFATSVQYIYQFITVLVCNHMLMAIGGETGVAAFGIIFNVSILAATVSDAISMALQPMVSTFRGERNRANIYHTLRMAFQAAMVLGVVMALILFLFPSQVCWAFGMRSGAELLVGRTAIRLYALCVLPSAVNMVMNYYYQALERELLSYILFTLRSFLFYLLFTFLFSSISLKMFWWTYFCTEVATLVILLIYGRIKGSFSGMSEDDGTVYRAFLDSRSANLGAVEQEVAVFMERLEATPKQSYLASAAVEEICGAILTNAFQEEDGYIQLTIVPHGEDGSVSVHVRDNARAFNPMEMDTESVNLTTGHGLEALGIKMLKARAKDFFYRRYAGFNTLVMRV